MMKIDPHTHSSEISRCSLCSLKELLNLKKSLGYDAIVLTNHAHPWDYKKVEAHTFNMRHYQVYKDHLEYAKSIGIKMFLGIEVTIEEPIESHILIYGTDEKFFDEAPALSYLSIKELYEYAHKHHCFVVQAHPYRGDMVPTDYHYLDAVEINCRQDDIATKDKLIAFAKQHHLKLTCGTDYHGHPGWPIGGMEIPDSIENNQQFVDYLCKTQVFSLFYKPEKYQFLNIRIVPNEKENAAKWFHEKWGIPEEAYLKCMNDFLSGKSKYGWYICKEGDQIIAGVGVVENDFHNRPDLKPNICALYVEEKYRNQGIAGKLLSIVVGDLRTKGITPIYLLTNHTGFYERYGWKFFDYVQGDGEDHLSRMYIHD